MLEKCQFTKEDFFSNQENEKIQTLFLLNKELIEESQKEKNKEKEDIKLNIKSNNSIRISMLKT